MDRPVAHKTGQANQEVLGIKLEHFVSRAGLVSSINNKVPDQRFENLRSDSERMRRVALYQNQKQTANEGQENGGFFDKKEKEFLNILKRIERIKNHKLEQAAADGP